MIALSELHTETHPPFQTPTQPGVRACRQNFLFQDLADRLAGQGHPTRQAGQVLLRQCRC